MLLPILLFLKLVTNAAGSFKMVITGRIHSNLTNEAHTQLCEVNKISSYAQWEQPAMSHMVEPPMRAGEAS